MKKILSITLISAITLVFSTGCSSKSSQEPMEMGAHIDKTDESTVKTAIFIGKMNTEKAISAIEKAGKKAGWRVTEFKSNAVIVEKIVDGKTMSSTIKIYNEHISGNKDNASMDELRKLREAIVQELKKKNSSSHH